MPGNWASDILVSCRQSTSGRTAASHSSTRGMRAFNEFTFHVAISTVGNLRVRPPRRDRRARHGPRPGGHPIAREPPGHADRLRGVNDTPAPAGTASPGTTDPVASEPLGPNAWLVE